MLFVERRTQDGERGEEQKDERRRRCQPNNNSNINSNSNHGTIKGGNMMTPNKLGRGECSSEIFVCELRRLLLQIRIAGQLGQDFVRDKQISELKALCRKVCTDVGKTSVVQELWAVVERRGYATDTAHGTNKQASTLQQDAEIISRAREILRRASVNASSNRNGPHDTAHASQKKCVVETSGIGESTREGGCESSLSVANLRESVPLVQSAPQAPPAVADGVSNESRTIASCPPTTAGAGVSGDGDVSGNPSEVLPLLYLADALGVPAAVNSCLDFIANEEETVASSAEKHFGSQIKAIAASCPPAQPGPPVDWAAAVRRLAARSRTKRTEAQSSRHRNPSPSLSPLTSSSPSSHTALSPSPRSPVEAVQSTSHCALSRSAIEDRLEAVGVVDGPARSSGDGVVGERGTGEAPAETQPWGEAADSLQGCSRPPHSSAGEDGIETGVALKPQRRGFVRCCGSADSDDETEDLSVREATARPRAGVAAGTHARRSAHMLRGSSRRASLHAPPPPLASPPPPPAEPERPAAARGHVDEMVHVEEGAPKRWAVRGRGSWCLPEGTSVELDVGDASDACDGRAAARGGVEGSPSRSFSKTGSRGAAREWELRHRAEKSDSAEGQREKVTSELGGRSGVDFHGRRCVVSRSYVDEVDGHHSEEDYSSKVDRPSALRKPMAVVQTEKTAQSRRVSGRASPIPRRKACRVQVRSPSTPSARCEREAPPSRCRRLRSTACPKDRCDGLGDGTDGSETTDSEEWVHAARPRSSTESLDSNSTPRSTARMLSRTYGVDKNKDEEGNRRSKEHDAEDEEAAAERSCTLARKRALLRVRLARQKQELANAVVDAAERGLRAERRRRREEKLAALLIKARGEARDGDRLGTGVSGGACAGAGAGADAAIFGVGNWGSAGYESLHFRDEVDCESCRYRPVEESAAGVLPKAGVARGAPWPRLPTNYGDEAEGCSDDDELPRQPLEVVPVPVPASTASVGGNRSWYGTVNEKNLEQAEEEDSFARGRGGGYIIGGGGGGGAVLDRFHRRARGSSPYSTLAVRIESLHIFCGDGPCTTGVAMYLVLEDGVLRHRTATRRPRREVRPDDDARSPGVATGENGDEPAELGAGVSGDDAARWSNGDHAPGPACSWVFHETVALRASAAGGREEGTGGRMDRIDDAGDDVLRVRAYAENDRSYDDPSRPCDRRGHFAPKHAARRGGIETKAGMGARHAAEARDEMIGSATIPLGRCLSLAGGARLSNGGGRSMKDRCTYSHTMEVLVYSPNDVPIGGIQFGVCGLQADRVSSVEERETPASNLVV